MGSTFALLQIVSVQHRKSIQNALMIALLGGERGMPFSLASTGLTRVLG
jgi:hypothetical protein